MKAGIITFHWAANYGAVLQAYALQEYLNRIGIDSYIIDYCPKKYQIGKFRWLCSKSINSMRQKRQQYHRNQAIASFRKKYFRVTKRYKSEKQLKADPPSFDVYISGSDQIWNPYFTMCGEGHVTLPYYLSFVPEGSKRISYASSFGLSEIPNEMKNAIKKELNRYSRISVRENTGKDILLQMDISSDVVADPTFLLDAKDYKMLAAESSLPETESYIFSFVLHGQDEEEKEMLRRIRGKISMACQTVGQSASVESWIGAISNAKFVLTNSFHCTVFCLMFHIPFISFESGPQKMGDRLHTLLTYIDLDKRFFEFGKLERLEEILDEEINWDHVEMRMSSLRNNGRKYLFDALNIVSD